MYNLCFAKKVIQMKETSNETDQKAGFFNLGFIFLSTLLVIFIKEEKVLEISFGYLQTEIVFLIFYYFYAIFYLILSFGIIKYSFELLKFLICLCLQVAFIYSSVILIYSQKLSVLSSLVASFTLFIYSFKLHSFSDYQNHQNISIIHFIYFLIIPSLIFREKYDQNYRIHIENVIKYLCQIMFCLIIDIIIYFQFIEYFILESHRHEVASKGFLYTVIKLSTPWFSFWLIASFGFFYSFLNLLAELTYFKNRDFYYDWWNSGSFEEFWRKWK